MFYFEGTWQDPLSKQGDADRAGAITVAVKNEGPGTQLDMTRFFKLYRYRWVSINKINMAKYRWYLQTWVSIDL